MEVPWQCLQWLEQDISIGVILADGKESDSIIMAVYKNHGPASIHCPLDTGHCDPW